MVHNKIISLEIHVPRVDDMLYTSYWRLGLSVYTTEG